MSAAKGKSSLFSSLGSQPSEPVRGAPPDSPAPSGLLQPLQERIDALEARLAEAHKNDPNERIAALEKQLKETQEKAIASMLVLREREEAQKNAQRESEAMLKSMAAQRRAEEFDRQLRDQLSNQRRRIDDLETRLVESATAAAGAQQLEPVIAAQRMADGRLSAYEAELRALAEKVEDLKRTGDASAAGLSALRAGLDLLKVESDARFAAADAASAAAASAASSLESSLARTRAELEAQSVQQREVSASAIAALRAALEGAGRGPSAAPDAPLAASLASMEGSLKAADESRMAAMKAEVAGLWEECSSFMRAVQASAAENAALESRLRSLLCAETAERKAALETLGAGLGERIDAKEGRWEARLAALRAEFAAHANRWETGAAELREKATANAQLSGALDYALKALKSEAAGVEALKRVEAELSVLQTEAGVWAQTRAYQAELTAHIEKVRLDFEQKLKASSGAVSSFQTEVRGLILSRVKALEDRVSKKES